MSTHELAQRPELITAFEAPGRELDKHLPPSPQRHRGAIHLSPVASRKHGHRLTASQLAFGPKSPFNAYFALAGWQLDEQRASQQLSAIDIAGIRDGTIVKTYGKDGKIYQLDPDRPGKIVGFTPNMMPAGEEWDAAKAGPGEYLATHYELAQTDPALVVLALVIEPMNKLQQALFELAAANQHALKRPDALVPDDALLAKVKIASQIQKAYEQLFYIMRDDIFGTKFEEMRVAEYLEAHHIDTMKFHARAQHMCTPEQIRKLGDDLLAQVPQVTSVAKPSVDADS